MRVASSIWPLHRVSEVYFFSNQVTSVKHIIHAIQVFYPIALTPGRTLASIVHSTLV